MAITTRLQCPLCSFRFVGYYKKGTLFNGPVWVCANCETIFTEIAKNRKEINPLIEFESFEPIQYFSEKENRKNAMVFKFPI
jgi:DNA-directed RNA polymerase subunit RPC12/RpoP